MDSKYNDFVTDMADLRKNQDYSAAAITLLDAKQFANYVGGGEAMAFIIHLAIKAFSVSWKSDVVLCSFGLLKGYERIAKLSDRRRKYEEESKFTGRRAKTESSSRSPQEGSKDWIARENILYGELARYFERIEDIGAFFVEAVQEYLVPISPTSTRKKLKLPTPSYKLGNPMPPHNLPQRQHALLGRRDIIRTLTKNFKAGKHILMLYGMGGVGKTEIALHYAYGRAGEYNTVAWINANSQLELHKSCLEFLQKYQPQVSDTSENAVRAAFLLCFEQSSNWLIVYDNADYLDNKTDDMWEVLASYMPKSEGHILITTRCDVDYAGAARTQIEVFAPDLAIDFLVNNTGLPANDDAVALAERLGYLPLALQYAASYIKSNKITYREYLDYWDEQGMKLFDSSGRHYAKQTVRQVFHITLDKIRDDTLARDLLNRLACLNVVHLPLERYLDAISNESDALWFDEIPKDAEEFSFVDQHGVEHRYRIGKGTFEYIPTEENPTEPQIIVDPMHAALLNPINRNELIRKLTEYSLVGWDGENLSMHPLLREIIFEEMPQKEREKWYAPYTTAEMLANVLSGSGNNELARKFQHTSLCEFLEMNKKYINRASRYIEQLKKNPDDIPEVCYKPDPESDYKQFLMLLSLIRKLDDADLFRQAWVLRREYSRILSESDEFLNYAAKERVIERWFYQSAANALHRHIIYRHYCSLEEREKLGIKYGINYVTYPAEPKTVMSLEVAQTIVDVWLDQDITVSAFESKIEELFADETNKWWVVATPALEESE